MQIVIGSVVAVLLTAPVSDAGVRAYLAAWRGDVGEARTVATARLAEAPGDPGALFVAAAVEIESGNLDAARDLTHRLATIATPPPEAAILSALVERRRRSHSERMDDALAEAWKAAGRPDLGSIGVLRDLRRSIPAGADLLPRVAPGALSRLGPEGAFLLGALAHPLGQSWAETPGTLERWGELVETSTRWTDRRSRDALAFARDPDSSSVGVSLCAYAVLRDTDAMRRVGASLARAFPDDGYIALARVLDGTADGDPLTGAELDAIEAAARKPRFALPFREAFADVANAARALDPAHAELLARAAFGPCTWPSHSPLTLARRAEATKEPSLRPRAARACDAIGQRLSESGSMLHRMMGYVLQSTAAALQGDAARKATLAERAHRWRERLDKAGVAAAVHAWPFPSIWRQWEVEGEIPYLERLAE